MTFQKFLQEILGKAYSHHDVQFVRQFICIFHQLYRHKWT